MKMCDIGTRYGTTIDNKDLTFEIVEHIATLRYYEDGFMKQLNLVSWNDTEPVYDIRKWKFDTDTGRPQLMRGVTLNRRELARLLEACTIVREV